MAKENDIIMLTLPPHTSHKLQPLDRTCYGPLKTAYSTAMDNWMRANPNRTVTIHDIAEIVNEAQMSAFVPRNVISGFRVTGISPYNDEIFTDLDFAPAQVTDREYDDAQQDDNQGNMEDVNNNDASDHRKRDEAGSSSEPPADPYEPLPLETDPTPMTSTSNSTPKHDANCLTRGYVSPSDITPLPKAPERKIKGGKRKKGSTRILTDTPVRNAIAVADELKRLKKSRLKKMKGANKSLFQ
jgi:hypothetical protein